MVLLEGILKPLYHYILFPILTNVNSQPFAHYLPSYTNIFFKMLTVFSPLRVPLINKWKGSQLFIKFQNWGSVINHHPLFGWTVILAMIQQCTCRTFSKYLNTFSPLEAIKNKEVPRFNNITWSYSTKSKTRYFFKMNYWKCPIISSLQLSVRYLFMVSLKVSN